MDETRLSKADRKMCLSAPPCCRGTSAGMSSGEVVRVREAEDRDAPVGLPAGASFSGDRHPVQMNVCKEPKGKK